METHLKKLEFDNLSSSFYFGGSEEFEDFILLLSCDDFKHILQELEDDKTCNNTAKDELNNNSIFGNSIKDNSVEENLIKFLKEKQELLDLIEEEKITSRFGNLMEEQDQIKGKCIIMFSSIFINWKL